MIPVSVLLVVARLYATLTETSVLAARNLGSGNVTKFEGTYPTKVSPLTEQGTCMINTSAPVLPVASSMIHS